MNENQTDIRLAMVGCGGIARAHLKAIASVEGAKLVGTVDIVAERAQQAAEEYGAQVYPSIEAVLAEPTLDAVVLPLPHHLHCSATVQAAEAGKHILVEKPMARNFHEATQMVEAADRAGVKLMVGQSTRFRPEVWAARELIQQGKLGEIRQCIYYRAFFIERLSTDWRYSEEECGGLYLPLFGSHDVDMILWLMDGEPAKVRSVLRSFTPLTDAESDGMLSIELIDDRIVNLAFSMNAHIARHHALFIGTEASLLIEDGRLLFDGEEIPVDREDAFVRQMRAFIDALRRDETPIASGQEVLATMWVLDKAASPGSE